MTAFATKYGPWCLVTGASDGIGREIALEAAARGCDLIVTARRSERLESLASSLAPQRRVLVVPADLSLPGGVAAVIDAASDKEVGLVAACAGFGTSGPFLESALSREREMLALNCLSVLELVHHFGRRMAERRRGGLVLMSSIVAFQGVPRAAHYAATKAWVQSFAEGLGRELSPVGVDVVASAPGPVDSGFASVANMRLGSTVDPRTVARETMDALRRRGTVRPGALSKLLGGALATLPRPLRVVVMEQVMAGMTRHHPEAARA